MKSKCLVCLLTAIIAVFASAGSSADVRFGCVCAEPGTKGVAVDLPLNGVDFAASPQFSLDCYVSDLANLGAMYLAAVDGQGAKKRYEISELQSDCWNLVTLDREADVIFEKGEFDWSDVRTVSVWVSKSTNENLKVWLGNLRAAPMPFKCREAAPDERRFAWCLAQAYADSGDWEKTAEFLKRWKFTDVIVQAGRVGGVHFDSAIVPRAKGSPKGDAIRSAIAACRPRGIRVHAMLSAFRTTKSETPKAWMDQLIAKEMVQRDPQGGIINHQHHDDTWLCPKSAETRSLVVSLVKELTETVGVDGVQLDYIRFASPEFCFCPRCLKAFSEREGRVFADAAAVRGDAAAKEDWLKFREECVAATIREVRDYVRAAPRKVELSATCFWDAEENRAKLAQDYGLWAREGLIEMLFPMDYTTNTRLFRERVMRQQRTIAGTSVKLYPGIVICSKPCAVHPERVIRNVDCVRELNLPGFAAYVIDARGAKFFDTLVGLVGGVGLGYESPAVVMDPAGPVKTPAAAVAKVRELRAAGKLAGRDAIVEIKAGRYRIAEPLVLTAEDSHIVFRGEGYDRTVIDGGVELPPFEVGADGVWVTAAKGLGEVRQVYVNGQRAEVARSPNQSYYFMTEEDKLDPKHSFYAESKDLAPLAKLGKTELQRVLVPVWMDWSVGYAEIASFDAEKSRVTLKSNVLKHLPIFMRKDAKPRYMLQNFRAALDAPGEWFFDADSERLFYIPRPGETTANTRAVVARSAGLVKIRGNRDQGKIPTGIAFEGIGFEHSAFYMRTNGWMQMQAHANIRAAAIEAEDSEDLRLVNCRVAHTGAHGILLGKGVRHSLIRHSLIEDLDGGGIYIGDIDADLDHPERNAGFVTVEDSIVRHGGRTFNGSIGVCIAKAGDCQVIHNEICDFFYTGVSVGWTWGYKPTVTKRNFVCHNRIHHLGQNVLSDMGAIYTLGDGEGSVISNNRIWEVMGFKGCKAPTWGLYTDEGSSHYVFVNNLLERCHNGAIHHHFGKENIYSNNICFACGRTQFHRTRPEKHKTVTLKNNIFVWDAPLVRCVSSWLGDFKSIDDVEADGNIWWYRDGKITDIAFKGKTWNDWRNLGKDKRGAIADPLFADPDHGDYTLKSDSPALKAGFVPFDWNDCGVYKSDAKWRTISE